MNVLNANKVMTTVLEVNLLPTGKYIKNLIINLNRDYIRDFFYFLDVHEKAWSVQCML